MTSAVDGGERCVVCNGTRRVFKDFILGSPRFKNCPACTESTSNTVPTVRVLNNANGGNEPQPVDGGEAQDARPLRIYVASSWRNGEQPIVVEMLREAGYEVYDFRHPNLGRGQEDGFRWSDIDPEWESWTPEQYRAALQHPIAIDGFGADKGGMDWADVCVMVAPCGRSAHSEAAYMAGQGKRSIVLLRPGEPELMYGLFSRLVLDYGELLAELAICQPFKSVRADLLHEVSEAGRRFFAAEDAVADRGYRGGLAEWDAAYANLRAALGLVEGGLRE